MIYRDDIDGLRAIAIIAILIFHIDPRFASGYIGVDIFFVISGFLITGIIWRDLEKKRFSFSQFYLKRIRRLFPALFGTLFFSFLFVLAFGLNTEIIMYGKSVLTSLYYISSVFFYTQNDYFASDLELNPLLHTWSLSVEEQFYLFFPIFIVFVYKYKARATCFLLALFFHSNTNYLESFSKYDIKGRVGKCFLTASSNHSELFDEKLCIKTTSKNNILLVGDSHAAHYYHALNKDFPHYNISQVNASGCRPVTTYKGEERCTKLMKKVFNEFINKYKFDTIILAGRWLHTDIDALEQTIKHIGSKVDQILVFGPVVEYNQSLPILLARFGNNENEQYQITNARNYQELLNTNDKMAIAINLTRATFIPIINLMCPEKKCITTLSNVPIQFDYGHLTYEGATFLLKHILK